MNRRFLCGLLACLLWAGGVQASELSDKLASRDHVLLIRHAYAPGVGDPAGYSLARCESQRTLDAGGKAQAQRIGQWLQAQGVRQAQVFTSIWCRCQQTAERLNLGQPVIEPSLASFRYPGQGTGAEPPAAGLHCPGAEKQGRARADSGDPPCEHPGVHGAEHRLG